MSNQLTVGYTVTNSAPSRRSPSWFDIGYLSADATLDNADRATVG